MIGPHNSFRIQTVNFYIGGQKADEQKEDGKRPRFDTSCPAPGDSINVQPFSATALGAIKAWVSYRCPPIAVRAYVYPEEIFGSLNGPIPFNSNSVLSSTPDAGVFSWARVPGANYSHEGNVNYLVIWAKWTPNGPFTYDGNVVFTAVQDGGMTCVSGSGIGSFHEPLPASGAGSIHEPPPASGIGSIHPLRPKATSTFPAKWRVEISGLEGPYASLNNVYIVKRSNSASSWENSGDGKTHCRVSICYCGQPGCWTLMVLWNGVSLTGEASSPSPFGPLGFEVHGASSCPGAPRIVATVLGA